MAELFLTLHRIQKAKTDIGIYRLTIIGHQLEIFAQYVPIALQRFSYVFEINFCPFKDFRNNLPIFLRTSKNKK